MREFEPIGSDPLLSRAASGSGALPAKTAEASVSDSRPRNVILSVLESVAARWTSLSGGVYDTTPRLRAESSHGIVFDNFYSIVGRSSNALGATLLSEYPKLDFHD